MDERFHLVAIETQFWIRFEKRHELAVMGKGLWVDLYEQNDSEQPQRINTRPDGWKLTTELPGKDLYFVNMKFTEPMSPVYRFIGRTIVYEPIHTLADLVNKKHFLRLTLEASNQEPFWVDVDIDWRRHGSLVGQRLF